MSDLAERFWRKVRKGPGECWTWTGARTSQGYGLFSFRLPRGRRPGVGAHRTAWQLVHNRTLKKRKVVIRHVCGNRACVNPAHLRAGSGWDNYLDGVAHGTVRAPSTLDPKLVAQVLSDIAAGVPGKHVAKKYGLSEARVHRMKYHPERYLKEKR